MMNYDRNPPTNYSRTGTGHTVRESPDCENRPFFLSGRTRESLLAQLICDLRQPLNLTKKLVEVLI